MRDYSSYDEWLTHEVLPQAEKLASKWVTATGIYLDVSIDLSEALHSTVEHNFRGFSFINAARDIVLEGLAEKGELRTELHFMSNHELLNELERCGKHLEVERALEVKDILLGRL
jgi:hypothetical protein